MKALGFMSGTSLDGVDAALLDTDGAAIDSFGPWLTAPFSPDVRAAMRVATALAPARDRASWPQAVRTAETALTRAHVDAGLRLLRDASLRPSDLDVVGFHGQTLWHRPPENGRAGDTLQIGDPVALGTAFGAPVVHDFRRADMIAGGHGAPLAPAYHAALFAWSETDGPVAALNLGGVANLTWVGRDGTLMAFDCGPGIGLIDDWVQTRAGLPYDEDGRLAGAGDVAAAVLDRLLAHPYFDAPPPKSLDRNAFSLETLRDLSDRDGAATLAAFTAAAVAGSLRFMPEPPRLVAVCGGGRKHPRVMAELSARLEAPVVDADQLGWRGDAVEAEAFAFLAARRLAAMPASYPDTTGVPTPALCGEILTL